MNIFFIGPYRQDNFDGIFCRNIVRSIAEKHNVFSRPIYYEGDDLIRDLDQEMQSYENNTITEYDYLVQHVKPIDCLRTNQFKKNILIPIVDDGVDECIFGNQTIDTILVDNPIGKTIANDTKTKIFDYNIYTKLSTDKVFDIGPLNAFKKLYFIGEYRYNSDNILGLIRSFIYLRNKINQEYCLALFIINITQNDINILQNYIQQTYKTLGANNTINRVVIVPISMNTDHIIAAHNSGDVLINFHTYPVHQINKKIAKQLSKKVIDSDNDSGTLFCNGNILSSTHRVFSDEQMIDSILNHIIDEHTNQITKNIIYENIADLL